MLKFVHPVRVANNLRVEMFVRLKHNDIKGPCKMRRMRKNTIELD